ncbi:MAG: PEPxxWA-CTERM sorting domain-containing protein [Sphingomicrobium sp.]
MVSSTRTYIAAGGAKAHMLFIWRRRLHTIAGAALALALITAVSVTTFGDVNLANAAIARAKSFIELMQQRSPGKRTQAHLMKIKHKLARHIQRPHERALPKVRYAIPSVPFESPPALIDILAPPIPITTASLEALPIPPLFQALITPPGIFGPPPPGFFIVPSLTPPASPPPIVQPPTVQPPIPQPTIVQPPPSAVPEPATWISMLLGFGLIGWQLRRRPQRKHHLVN